MARPRITAAVALNIYNRAPKDAKRLIQFFMQSLLDNGYIIPDYFFADKDPNGFRQTIKDASELVKKVPIEKLFRTLSICHTFGADPFWGRICPVFKISTLAKAYNGLLHKGVLNDEGVSDKFDKNRTTYWD